MRATNKVFRVVWGPQRFYLSMGWKTLIAFALVASIPLLGLLTLTTNSFRGVLEQEIARDLGSDLTRAWSAFRQPAERVRVMLDTLSGEPRIIEAMARRDSTSLTSLFGDTARRFAYVDAWIATGNDMTVLGSLTGKRGQMPTLSSALRHLAVGNRGASFSTEVVSSELLTEYGLPATGDRAERELVQVIAAPVGEHGTLLALIRLGDGGYLPREIFQNLGNNDSSLAIAMDSRVVATEPSGNHDWTVGGYLPDEIRNELMNGKPFRGMATIGDRSMQIVADPIYNSDTRVVGGLLMAAGIDRADRQLESYINPIYIFLGLGMLMSMVIAYLAYRDILTPLQAITNAQNSFAAGDRGVRTEIVTRDEFERLGEGFNRMADSLQEYEQRIDQYTQLSTLASQRLDPEELQVRALDRVVEITRSAIGALFLSIDNEARLRPVMAHGIDLDSLTDVRVGDGLPGRAALEQKPKRQGAAEGEMLASIETGLGVLPIQEIIYLPLVARGNLLGLLLLGGLDTYSDSEFALHAHLAAQVALILDNSRSRREADELALRDSMTGVYNRQHMTVLAERCYLQASRDGAQLAAMMVDIDHFHTILQRYGFQVADSLLTRVAHRLRKALAGKPMIGRFDEQSFVVLLPGYDGEQALLLAETLRKEILVGSLLPTGEESVTISIGIATSAHEEVRNGIELIRRAATAVQDAKHRGRNRVTLA